MHLEKLRGSRDLGWFRGLKIWVGGATMIDGQGRQEYYLGSIMIGTLGCPSEVRGGIPSLVGSEMRSPTPETPRVVLEQEKLPLIQ